MTRTELVSEIAMQTGLAGEDVDKAVKAFVNVVTEELKKGGKVQMIGFGTFETTDRPAGEVRNPRTGEMVAYEASRAPRFKPGKAFKEAVNEAE
ncbi:MAG: HU family DNA-binding protein [bacterium]